MAKKTSILGIILFLAACLLLPLIISPLFLPGTVIDIVDGEARVHIETDRQWILFPWDCYTMSWAVFGTVSVYLDGGGVIGEYTRPVCVEWHNAPTFEIDHIYTINKTDGTARDFILPQRVLTGRAEFWVGLVLIVGLVLVADRLGATPWRSRWLHRHLAKLPAARLSLIPEQPLSKRQQVLVIVALFAIFMAGFTMRVYHVYLLGESNYPAWAWRNNFGGLTQVYLALVGPDSAQLVEGGRILYPPGYLFVLKVTQNLGIDFTGLRILQSLWDVCSIFPLYWLLQRLRVSVWLSLLGMFIYAIYPPCVIGSTFILGEWVVSSLIVWLTWSLIFATDHKKPWSWGLVGFIAGIAAIFRSDTLPIVGLIALWLLFQRFTWRHLIKAVFALGTSFGILLMAAGFYNLTQFGRFTVSSTAGGYALWSGLGMLPNDYGYFVSDMRASELLASLGLTYNSLEANQYFTDEYFRAWRERPFYVLSSIVYRWVRIASDQEWWLTHWSQLPEYEFLTSVVRVLSTAGIALVVIASFLVRRNARRFLMVLFPLVSVMLTIGLVYYEPRYTRYSALSYLFAFIFVLDWLYNYCLRTIYYWRQQWHLQYVRIVLSSLIIIPAFYLGLQHLLPTVEFMAQRRQTEQTRNAFTAENTTPAYTLSSLDWQTSWEGAHFEDQWLVAANSAGLKSSPHADIPTAGAQFVIVHVEVEWLSGIGYAALVDSSQRERDQVAIQSTSPSSFELIAYTSDLDFITLAFTAIDAPEILRYV